ncbi:TIM barrel protein [Massilibacteroides sp.]|uniref:TIM barrel protein n=1 Tax=Massilibacteroides sp. TaxID=2034766 RepID=UPI002604CA3F|nr:TIM barrel protein [Massilibacteroides sp.]MDD4514036.1 TIM barrel protein [Massilibacteroides sp.]
MRKYLGLFLFVSTIWMGCQSNPSNSIDKWVAGSANDDVFIPMTQEQLNELAEFNMPYLEVDWYKAPKENTEEWAVEVKRRADKAGVRIWSVHLPFSRTYDISTVDETIQQGAVEKNIKDMEMSAKALKPTYFVIHPSLEPIADEERPLRLEACKKSMQVLADKAKELGVTLLVENLPRTCLGNTADEMLEILQADDALAVCFDVNHLLKESHSSFVAKVGHKIKSTHMSDYDFVNERHWLAGEGLINWNQLFDDLLGAGYPGPFIFEPNCGEKPNAPSVKAMSERWEWLKQDYKEYLNKKKQPTSKELKVLQINTWQETTIVPKGFFGLVNLIKQINPDVVLLCEIRNYEGKSLISNLLNALEKKGCPYYGESLDLSVGVLSKYQMQKSTSAFTLPNNSRPMLKTSVDINGKSFVFYSAHLDYTHYECYLPRGYSGTTWKQLEKPVTDVDSILAANRMSMRDEAIVAFLDDAEKESQKGNIVILGGDFNEPSHLDWQEDTKNMRDHQGVVINWDCSVLLQDKGYIDAFREQYPNPVDYPGFTFPAATEGVELKKLAWAPEVDERDRIDFIYYRPTPGLKLADIRVVGPSGTILYGKRAASDSKDIFIEPIGVWPTDHKGLLATFKLD